MKHLLVRKTKLETELKSILDERASLQSKEAKIRNQINLLTEEIKKLTKNEIVVSEHAILRYLERVMGIDMDMIRKEILSEDLKVLIDKFGNGKFPIKGGQAVVKDNVITTIIN